MPVWGEEHDQKGVAHRCDHGCGGNDDRGASMRADPAGHREVQ